MAISRRRNQVGQTGSMQMVDSREVQASLDEYLDKDTVKNRSERRRLGEKFYRKYWGCLECSCGHCGTVYRFPNIKDKSERTTFTVEDRLAFNHRTRIEKCPCCQKSINELMPTDAKIYFERREIEIGGVVMLKLIASEPLDIPTPKIEIEE